MCWSRNSRKNRSCVDKRMSYSRNRYSKGATCTNGWNCTHTSYRSISAVGIEQTRWAVLLIVYKGIQQHACHCAHACDPTLLAHSLSWRSKSDLSWKCILTSWCAWPPTHAWRSTQTLCISMLSVWPHPRWPCACYRTSWIEEPY